MQRCADCDSVVLTIPERGDGRCRHCHGSGSIHSPATTFTGQRDKCSDCSGTGQCQTCGGKGMVTARDRPARPHAGSDDNPFDDKVAVRAQCPNCGDTDWFEWKFLGRLKDPVCGHDWFVDVGTYTLQQIRAIFESARKSTKYMTSGVSGEGAWIGKLLGAFLGIVIGIAFRLPFALFMIPIQAIVRQSRPRKSGAASQGTPGAAEPSTFSKARGQSVGK